MFPAKPLFLGDRFSTSVDNIIRRKMIFLKVVHKIPYALDLNL